MAETTDRKFNKKDIVGLKYFSQLGVLLQQLHDVGCERDRAGNSNSNSNLHQYCILILLYTFNPVVTSLRRLQQASELK